MPLDFEMRTDIAHDAAAADDRERPRIACDIDIDAAFVQHELARVTREARVETRVRVEHESRAVGERHAAKLADRSRERLRRRRVAIDAPGAGADRDHDERCGGEREISTNARRARAPRIFDARLACRVGDHGIVGEQRGELMISRDRRIRVGVRVAFGAPALERVAIAIVDIGREQSREPVGCLPTREIVRGAHRTPPARSRASRNSRSARDMCFSTAFVEISQRRAISE